MTKHITKSEVCPRCRSKLLYNSLKSSRSNYSYLYFSCNFCLSDIRISPTERDIYSLETLRKLQGMEEEITHMWKEKALKYEHGLATANKMFEELWNNLNGIIGNPIYDTIALFLFDQGKINRVSRLEVMKYAMRLLRNELRIDLREKISELKDEKINLEGDPDVK